MLDSSCQHGILGLSFVNLKIVAYKPALLNIVILDSILVFNQF